MAHKYSFTGYNKDHMARAIGKSLPISVKVSIEVSNNLRKMTVAKAKTFLREVLAMKKAVSFKRFTNGLGHRRGSIGAGRFPQKAATEILALIEAVEANAQFKGLNTSALIIKHISAQNAGNQWRYGRHRRRKMKKTHVELVLEEGKVEEKPAVKKAEKKSEPKEEKKAVEAKEEKKVVDVKPTEKPAEPKEEKKEVPKESTEIKKETVEKAVEKAVEAKEEKKVVDVKPTEKPAEPKEDKKAAEKPVEAKPAEPKEEKKPVEAKPAEKKEAPKENSNPEKKQEAEEKK